MRNSSYLTHSFGVLVQKVTLQAMCFILQPTQSRKQQLRYDYCNKHKLRKKNKLYQTRKKFKVVLCLQGTLLMSDPLLAFSGITK